MKKERKEKENPEWTPRNYLGRKKERRKGTFNIQGQSDRKLGKSNFGRRGGSPKLKNK